MIVKTWKILSKCIKIFINFIILLFLKYKYKYNDYIKKNIKIIFFYTFL